MGIVALAAVGLASPQAARAEPWTLQKSLDLPDKLKLAGGVRVRYEGLTGQSRAGLSRNTDLYAIRSHLEAEYDAGWLRFGAELQDSRAYGGTPRSGLTSNEVNTFEFIQAYVIADVTTPMGPGTVQAGRFVIPALGSRRLIAPGDDRNAATGFTGLKLDTKAAGGTSLTLLFVVPQLRLPDDQPSVLDNKWAVDRENFNIVVWGGLLAKPNLFGKTGGDLGFYGLDERDAPGRLTRNRRLRTATARLIRAPAAGQVNYEAEVGYQFGSIAQSTTVGAPRLGVSAYFLHLEAGYQFKGAAKARLSAVYDRASGDDGKGRYGRFDSLFGMRRGDYAPGGLFGAVGRSNISAPGLKFDVAPDRRTELYFTYRGLWLATKTDSFATTGVRDASGASGRYAGQLVEARLRYWLIPNALRLEADGVALLKGRFLKVAPNAPRTPDTRYLSLSLTSTF